MITENIYFTPTQQRIMDLLSDGNCHKMEEIIKAVDEQADSNVAKVHIYNIKTRIHPYGYTIACKREPSGEFLYYIGRKVTIV